MLFINLNVEFEDLMSLCVLEGGENRIGVEFSDVGFDGFWKVLEVVIDVGFDILLDFFDSDEFCSVLSEFILRFSFFGKRFFLRIEFSKLLFFFG